MKQHNIFNHIILLVFILLSSSMYAQQRDVTGIVTDSNSQPLPGANILIKGSAVGTLSDFDGNYTIKASTGDVIVISYVGFLTQEISLGNQTTLNVQLKEDAALLSEVVLIGYGAQKKSSLTASVEVLMEGLHGNR